MTRPLPAPYRFKGKRYENVEQQPGSRTLRDTICWFLTRKPTSWPEKVQIRQEKVRHQRVGMGKLHVTFVNHSTVLLQLDNLNILTDPIWSDWCGPFRWAALKRTASPGIRFEDLPPIDLVLISHNHYDHMDIPTLRRLQEVHHPLFCVSQGDKGRLESKGFSNVHELGWWEEKTFFNGLKVHFVPARHFSRRGLLDRNRTLWGGFVIESSQGPVYFAGDTGYTKHFKEIFQRFGPMRLALLPIGAYTPEWFMSSVHMSPQEAVQAHLDLHSKQSIAIHYGTFRLSDEAIDQPIKELTKALFAKQIDPSKFIALKAGQGSDVC